MDQDWGNRMACAHVDPTIFDGANPNLSRRNKRDWEPARLVCGSCPVTDECLEYVMSLPVEWNDDPSYAAGRTPAELRAERGKRARRSTQTRKVAAR